MFSCSALPCLTFHEPLSKINDNAVVALAMTEIIAGTEELIEVLTGGPIEVLTEELTEEQTEEQTIVPLAMSTAHPAAVEGTHTRTGSVLKGDMAVLKILLF